MGSPLLPLAIERFRNGLSINRFSCGRPQIDRFVKNYAKKAEKRLEHRVYVAMNGPDTCPVGFYALQLGSESLDVFDSRPDDYIRNLPAFPAVHLSFLGVRSDVHRRGVGRFLIADVIAKAYEISDHAGFYALTLVSLDDESTKFYKGLGFVPYSTRTAMPKMLLPIGVVRRLVETTPALS